MGGGGGLETVNWRRTWTAMITRKRTKRQWSTKQNTTQKTKDWATGIQQTNKNHGEFRWFEHGQPTLFGLLRKETLYNLKMHWSLNIPYHEKLLLIIF